MPDVLKVLYCVPIAGWGGVERFLRDVILRHDPERVRPMVLAFSDGAWLREPAGRIRMLAAEDGLRDTLGVQAQLTVARRFSAERATRQLERAYEEVMQ